MTSQTYFKFFREINVHVPCNKVLVTIFTFSNLSMLKLCLLFALPTLLGAYKDKTTDEEYSVLTPVADVPVGCNNARNDYALVDGKLEKCR